MAVDFGILNKQQIPVGGVVGTVPNSPSSLDSLAGGIMQGAQTGANIAAQRQLMGIRDAQEQRAQQIFPAELQNANAVAQKASIDAANAEDTRAKLKASEAEFNKSFDRGLAYIQKNDPKTYLDYKKTMADTKLVMAQTAEKITDNNIKSADAQDLFAARGADLAQVAAQGKTPEEQQALYDQKKGMMAPTLAAMYPKQYSHDVYLALTKIGTDAQFKMAQKQLDEKATPLVKNQKQRDIIQSRIGTPQEQSTDKQNLQELNQAITSNGQPPANQQVNIATTTDRLKETGKTASMAASTLSSVDQMEKLSDAAFSGVGSESKLKVNQFLEFIGQKPAKGTDATEVFNQVVRNAQLNAQTLLKGSASDRDMEIIEQTGPQLKNTKAGRDLMLSSAGYKAKMDQQYNAFLNAFQNKNNGSLDGADEAWNNYRQSRNDFDKKTLKFDRSKVDRKSWEPFLDPSYQAPKQETSSKLITIKNNKTGETKQVTEEEARSLGAM